jgi:hypothetical protein
MLMLPLLRSFGAWLLAVMPQALHARLDAWARDAALVRAERRRRRLLAARR